MPGAILFDKPGPASVLEWTQVDPLKPGRDEVVIAVAAAGVNNADLLQRKGAYPVPAGSSPILGLECAGHITSIGNGVTGWSVGDRVCALLDGGGYADEVAVPASQVMPIPDTRSILEAAVFPEAACTVYSNLAMIAGVRPGQTVLIHGATGGIGTFAIQWAKAVGARVITTADGDAKVATGRKLGADAAIDYRTQDFVGVTLDITKGRGVDAILDVVGASYLDRNLRCLADDGHLVIIGGSLSAAALDLSRLMDSRASVSATRLRPRPLEQKAEIVARVRKDVLPYFAAGHVRPVIDTIVPLREAARAHPRMESGAHIGKVVLDNRDTTKRNHSR
ncbi:NAD(P)H-quinone oxidoreductase [Mycobacterium sherrisii]|uniref:NAD(P)H-quinone oxidoreductase n=1 Tax=Mycobacterium sherrisii TaxID=243061 RepID=UPI000A160A40|nr:NAD(P)H-quinone oxidoreductase [Mycobacterium sherrisii]MCV7029688.1 NAD(P)H-quinone oxidoreductase [Mycobacterium sherrisii]ORW74974.1 NADPH:quinone oxidoreductase [Mycobacterium sherrisii]